MGIGLVVLEDRFAILPSHTRLEHQRQSLIERVAPDLIADIVISALYFLSERFRLVRLSIGDPLEETAKFVVSIARREDDVILIVLGKRLQAVFDRWCGGCPGLGDFEETGPIIDADCLTAAASVSAASAMFPNVRAFMAPATAMRRCCVVSRLVPPRKYRSRKAVSLSASALAHIGSSRASPSIVVPLSHPQPRLKRGGSDK